jgi:hypothetical protein
MALRQICRSTQLRVPRLRRASLSYIEGCSSSLKHPDVEISAPTLRPAFRGSLPSISLSSLSITTTPSDPWMVGRITRPRSRSRRPNQKMHSWVPLRHSTSQGSNSSPSTSTNNSRDHNFQPALVNAVLDQCGETLQDLTLYLSKYIWFPSSRFFRD